MSEKQYEIVMYKLLTIVMIGMFVAIAVGFFFGKAVGKMDIEVETPEYCHSQISGDKVTIECNELPDTTVADLCELLSEGMEEKTKVVLIT
jgi:hypothetical protein